MQSQYFETTYQGKEKKGKKSTTQDYKAYSLGVYSLTRRTSYPIGNPLFLGNTYCNRETSRSTRIIYVVDFISCWFDLFWFCCFWCLSPPLLINHQNELWLRKRRRLTPSKFNVKFTRYKLLTKRLLKISVLLFCFVRNLQRIYLFELELKSFTCRIFTAE